MSNNDNEKMKEEFLKSGDKPFSNNNLQSQPDPPIESVGGEFVEWAERYWNLKIVYFDDLIVGDSSENSSYNHMKEIFIKKINGLIEERLRF